MKFTIKGISNQNRDATSVYPIKFNLFEIVGKMIE